MKEKLKIDDELLNLQDRLLEVQAGRDDGQGVMSHPRFEEAVRGVALLQNAAAELRRQQRREWFRAAGRSIAAGLGGLAVGGVAVAQVDQASAHDLATKLAETRKERDQLKDSISNLKATGYLSPVSFPAAVPTFVICGQDELLVSCTISKIIKRVEINWGVVDDQEETEVVDVKPELFQGQSQATIVRQKTYKLHGQRVVTHIKAVADEGGEAILQQLGNTPKERERSGAFLCAELGIVWDRTDEVVDRERRLALWVIAQGGNVNLHHNEKKEMSSPQELPKERFRIQTIDLGACNLTDQSLREGLGSDGVWLQYLTLARNSQLTDETLLHLSSHYQTLFGLWAPQTNFTDRGLVHLSKSKSLNLLVINNAPITKLDPLLELPSLQTLHVQGCPIGDEAVPILCKLTKLQELRIADTKITPAGVAELRKALPNCRIE